MNMQETKRNWWSPISLGFLMFATYVGPGFATGAQTVQYFLTKGWIGVWLGPVVVGLISFVWLALAMEVTRVYKVKDYRDLTDKVYKNPVVRTALGLFIDISNIAMVLVVLAAMISGGANVLNTVWGVDMTVGTIIFAAIIFVLCSFFAKFVLKIGDVLTFVILGITLYMAVVGFGPAWEGMLEFVRARTGPIGFTLLNSWYIIVIFMNNFTNGYIPAIPASNGLLKTRTDAILAAAVSSILCTSGTMVYTIIFAAGMPDVTKEAIPVVWSLRNTIQSSVAAEMIYGVLALAAILSTAVGLLFGMIKRFDGFTKEKLKINSELTRTIIIVTLALIVATLGSSFGIIAIINYGFVISSGLTFPIHRVPFYFAAPYRLYQDKKAGLLDENGVFKGANDDA